MKDKITNKKLLTESNHPLLSLKEVLDELIKEAESLPIDVGNTRAGQGRNLEAFREGQEKINDAVK